MRLCGMRSNGQGLAGGSSVQLRLLSNEYAVSRRLGRPCRFYHQTYLLVGHP